jgi:RNA polymerase sigma-70 factor, ECF subfamily
MTDQELDLRCLERLQTGDSKALEELFDRYSPLLYPMVLRILRSPSDAEDTLQEVWLQVWKRVATFDAKRGSVAAWLVMLARSRALDRYRSLASRRNAETRVEAAPEVSADDASTPAAQRQLSERVTSALAQLAPQQRQVIEIAYFEGLSQTEIAQRLNAPLGTVKSWTRQGLMKLRELVPQEVWA